jgi:7,8-dihydroneopterin aldolase/epimerase/oxygenase
MGMISVEGMEFFAYHGCFAEEQVIGTRFIVDFYFEADTANAEASDDIRQTVNYQTVYQLVKKEMGVKSHLLEHLAHRILKSVTNAFPVIIAAEVKISKLNPPLGGKVDKVCVALSTDDWTDAEQNT